MPDGISRRTVLVAISAVAASPAQTPPPEGKLPKANADVKDSSTRLTQIAVPMDLEPAITFHV